MVSVFIFSGLPFGLNFVGQFLEIKRSDKTGAKIVDSVRQEYSHFHAVLSGEINHSRVSGVIAYYAAGPKLLAQVFRNPQSCGAIGQHIGSIKIFNTLFFADKVNNSSMHSLRRAQQDRGDRRIRLCASSKTRFAFSGIFSYALIPLDTGQTILFSTKRDIPPHAEQVRIAISEGS